MPHFLLLRRARAAALVALGPSGAVFPALKRAHFHAPSKSATTSNLAAGTDLLPHALGPVVDHSSGGLIMRENALLGAASLASSHDPMTPNSPPCGSSATGLKWNRVQRGMLLEGSPAGDHRTRPVVPSDAGSVEEHSGGSSGREGGEVALGGKDRWFFASHAVHLEGGPMEDPCPPAIAGRRRQGGAPGAGSFHRSSRDQADRAISDRTRRPSGRCNAPHRRSRIFPTQLDPTVEVYVPE